MFTTIKAALDALPTGAEAIADHLGQLGIRGTCTSPSECVIAEYLTATVEVPVGLLVRVSNNAAAIARHAHPIVAAKERCWFADVGVTKDDHVERPDLIEFIANFDRGQYPALVGDAMPVAA